MAALIALLAAGIAYRGAMAKVNLDREINDRQNVRDRQGLYLRLNSQLRRLQEQAVHVSMVLEERIGSAKNASIWRIKWDSRGISWTNLMK